MRKIFLTVFVFLLIGCAPPALIKKEAQSDLSGDCLKLFSCGMPGCYNYGNPGDKPITAFAIAFSKDKRQQVCASTRPQDIYKIKDCEMWGCDFTPKEVQDLAIQRCEKHKLTTHIYPKDWDKCEIYAIGWNIVYKKNKDIEVKKSEPIDSAPTIKTPKVSIDDAKKQCTDIGFKVGTERFGECVLELNK
jgi:hypothetical protein